MDYLYVGLLLSVISGCCFLTAVTFLLWSFYNHRKPAYHRKLPSVCYPEEVMQEISYAYEAAGDIHGMLLLLKSKGSGKSRKRIEAAWDYLENSRYKDWETTLQFLSDGTPSCAELLDKILETEIRKRNRLICQK